MSLVGFDKETSPLSAKEMEMIPGMVVAFSKRVGKDNAITSKEIIAKYKEQGIKLDGARLRKMINHIRINNLVPNLIGSNNGYWVENDKQLLKIYVEGLLSRANAIKVVAVKLGQNL